MQIVARLQPKGSASFTGPNTQTYNPHPVTQMSPVPLPGATEAIATAQYGYER